MGAYVYALRGRPEDLQGYVRALGQPLCHWVADGAQLTTGRDLPQQWKDQGAIFGPKGELRWWRMEADYRALLLTDAPVNGLEPLPGEWKAEAQILYLQNLNDRRVHPNFSIYPHGKSEGRFKAVVYYLDGVSIFISPRELLAE